MFTSFSIAALLAFAPTAPPSQATPAEGFAWSVAVGDIEFEAPVPAGLADGATPYWAWWRSPLDPTRAFAEGDTPGSPAPAGSEIYFLPAETAYGERVSAGTIVARSSSNAPLHGVLLVPRLDPPGADPARFVLRPEGASQPEAFEAGRRRYYAGLRSMGLPGTAWFRHQATLGLTPEEAAAEAVETLGNVGWIQRGDELGDTFALFSGGRAVAENLQLERAIPVRGADGAADADVDVDSLKGIEVEAFDWKPLLTEPAVPVDPLAAWIPADQHALFAPSFTAFIALLDELQADGASLLAAFEGAGRDAQSRARLETQLALSLDEATRLLGPAIVQSVALTGGDLYLRSGSDVALLLEARLPDQVLGLVRARQRAALARFEGAVESEMDGVYSVLSPDRALCSYSSVVDGAVVVANSPVALARIRAARAGASLAASDELRFFRQRYPRGGDETAFVLLPDAAIRRWCGPRWRIAASRRVRAMAALLDLQAGEIDALAHGMAPVVSPEATSAALERYPSLGTLAWSARGVRSSTMGTLDFQTPIAEMDVQRVSQEEARLYGLWRDGYEQNWSRFFDPIAARLVLEDGAVELDVTVLPLIGNTDYRDLREWVGKAQLAPSGGDPHDEAIFQFALAIDPESDPVREVTSMLSDFAPGKAADVLSWIGGDFSIYADASEVWDELATAEDLDDALENLTVDPNAMPLTVVVGSKSPLRLAAWMTALRAFADTAAPGLTRYETRQTEAGDPYVRIVGEGLTSEDFSLYYATLPEALVLSLNEPALQATIARLRARREAPADAPPTTKPWLGESAAARLTRSGLVTLAALMREPYRDELTRESFAALPILNEWKRLFPDEDPVRVHERLFGEHLACPAGGDYVWNAEWRTMESSVLGHPANPRTAPNLPPVLERVQGLSLGLTFEHDGLRARARVER